ncbi:hypothetical protein K2Z83_22945, partial [Oscillochloris sp. ZM17-4]|uniref:WD40 repeat domain-containing protein n=1 Tax=Oscillochloris sp. ZM17-4 TaxID=2866714 RepID=UPI00351D1B59|nr:hypothetical protein [Oscillochloris sp. ZM17-4]
SAAYSPDGTRIVTASLDGTAKVWDAASGAALATLQGHTSGVTSAAFNPQGDRIVTASYDGTAKVFLAQTADLLALASCSVGRDLTTQEIANNSIGTPFVVDFATRQCPPVYSWQRASTAPPAPTTPSSTPAPAPPAYPAP